MSEVEHLKIAGQEFARNLIVQRMMRVVALLEQTANREANLLGIRLGQSRLNGECDDQQTRQEHDRATVDIFHKFGKKSSQKSF
jgi:hypothetical protein